MPTPNRVEDTVDAEGYIVPGYSWWDCKCGDTVERYRGQSDVSCSCGQWYNAFGQELRNDWHRNRSNYDDDVSDMDGYEDMYAGGDW